MDVESDVWSLSLGSTKVDFPAAMKGYNEIRCFWVKRSNEARRRFVEDVYADRIPMDDNFFSLVRHHAENLILANEIKELARIVASAGKYEIDENIIERDYHDEIYGYWEKALNDVWQCACAIDNQQQYEANYREAQKNSRGQVIGGGFGVSGMLQGMMIAGAVNAATGMVHSATNAIGNFASMVRASNSRLELYEETKQIFPDAIELTVYMIHLVHCKIMGVEVQPGMDYDKCRAILNNIKNLIPQNDIIKAFCDCFRYDPYLEDIYKQYLLLHPDNETDLQSLAKEFEIDLCVVNEEQHKVYSEIVSENGKYFIVNDISDVPTAKQIVLQNDKILSPYINTHIFNLPTDINILDDFIATCKKEADGSSNQFERNLYNAYLNAASPIMNRAIEFLSSWDLINLLEENDDYDASTVDGIDRMQEACHKIKYATDEQLQKADRWLNKRRSQLLNKGVGRNNNAVVHEISTWQDAHTPDISNGTDVPSNSDVVAFEKKQENMWLYFIVKIVFWFCWSAFLVALPIFISIPYIGWYIYRTFYKRFRKFRRINGLLPKEKQLNDISVFIMSLKWI